jgi:sporulation protein YlmC with PRC-barrel domain
VALKVGVRVFTSDGKETGEVEQVLAEAESGRVTHLVVDAGILTRGRR